MSNAKLGLSFEKYFDKCLSIAGWSVVRIPDGCQQISQFKIIRKKSPFDFAAVKSGKAFFCDVKTTIGETFPYSAINQLQVNELLKIQQNGFHAGYIVNFRQVDKFCFISAKELSEIVPGGSIKARMCIDLGKEIDIEKLFVETNNSIN